MIPFPIYFFYPPLLGPTLSFYPSLTLRSTRVGVIEAPDGSSLDSNGCLLLPNGEALWPCAAYIEAQDGGGRLRMREESDEDDINS